MPSIGNGIAVGLVGTLGAWGRRPPPQPSHRPLTGLGTDGSRTVLTGMGASGQRFVLLGRTAR